MDNKPLEKQAENYIKSQLIRFGFQVHDLSFDKKGSDLLITKEVAKQRLKFLTIQCKGRKLSGGTSTVKIPAAYVKDNFILFVYVTDEDRSELLYIFYPIDIREWQTNSKSEYVLNFTKNKLLSPEFKAKLFNQALAVRLQELLDLSEVKDYTSVFIDGIFLEKAIRKTIELYSGIWPGKKYVKPTLNTVVKNILEVYNRFKSEKEVVNCFVFMSRSFSLENQVHIDYENLKFTSKEGSQVRMYLNKSDEIISFEIMAELDRLIDNDNILLVANDRVYERYLSDLKTKGYDIIIVRYNMRDDNDMNSDFRWEDVMWPLGRSIGLDINEL